MKTTHAAGRRVIGCKALIALGNPQLAQALATPLTAPFSWVQLPHASLYKSWLARAVCLTLIRFVFVVQPFSFTCIRDCFASRDSATFE